MLLKHPTYSKTPYLASGVRPLGVADKNVLLDSNTEPLVCEVNVPKELGRFDKVEDNALLENEPVLLLVGEAEVLPRLVETGEKISEKLKLLDVEEERVFWDENFEVLVGCEDCTLLFV